MSVMTYGLDMEENKVKMDVIYKIEAEFNWCPNWIDSLTMERFRIRNRQIQEYSQHNALYERLKITETIDDLERAFDNDIFSLDW